MKRGSLILALLLLGSHLAVFAVSGTEIPAGIRNNNYFRESVRLTNLAQQAYDEGDYDTSSLYSEEAVRYAELSDEYVRLQLKIAETDSAITAARRRLEYAASLNAAARFPVEYGRAQANYDEARYFRTAENWDSAIAAANRVLIDLAFIDDEEEGADGMLPSQYTVRTWSEFRDCLWNIAGRSWVYADSRKWELLYEANKARMPESDNPDLIHPGMILDIPSVKGEERRGMWTPDGSYPSF